jgi:streptogramin lyase
MSWQLAGGNWLGRGKWGSDGRPARRCRPVLGVEALDCRQLLSAVVVEVPVANPAGTVNALTVGLNGDIWYSETLNTGTNVLGEINPATGAVIAQDQVNTSGIGITGLAAGPDNGIWFTETNAIGRLDATTGQVTGVYSLAAGDVPQDITLGPDNNLWFTIRGTGQIGAITTTGTIIGEFPLPSYSAANLTAPGVITSDPTNGTLWFSESLNGLMGHFGRIGKITTAGQVTEFPGQVGPSSSTGLALDDGSLWVTDGRDNLIDQINPTTGAITGQFSPPTGNSLPYDITAGPNQDLYFTEQGGNQIGMFTPSNPSAITEIPVPTPGAEPYQIVAGDDGNVWFSELNHPAIGVVEVSGHGPTGSGGGQGGSSPAPTVAPTIVAAAPLDLTVPVGKPRKGKVKTRTQFEGFQLTFNEALDPSRAANAANYTVLSTKRGGRKPVTKPVSFRVAYTPGGTVVDLILTSKQTFAKGGKLAVNATPSGIADVSGDPLTGTNTFTILPKAHGLT